MKTLFNFRYKIFILLNNLLYIYIVPETFPGILKVSQIVLIHKKGFLDGCTNYRPIPMVPFSCKTFLRALKLQNTEYWYPNDIFLMDNNLDIDFIDPLSYWKDLNGFQGKMLHRKSIFRSKQGVRMCFTWYTFDQIHVLWFQL